MYTENELGMERNEAVVIDLPGENYTIEADIKTQANRKYS